MNNAVKQWRKVFNGASSDYIVYSGLKMKRMMSQKFWACTHTLDNFRMNTRYGRYGATYNMIGFCCFNEELSLLPKNPTEAKLQATSTRGESTEPT
jgi:hypothetical protein